MDSFAHRVSTRRKSLGMTQGEVARQSGLKQPDISKIERGEILQTTELLSLASALKCNPYWLETGKGDMEQRVVDVFPTVNDQLLRHIVNLATLLQSLPTDCVDAAYYSASQVLIEHVRASQNSLKSQRALLDPPVKLSS